MNDELYTCPVCGSEFDTRHTIEWAHCELCGAHGTHECPGPIGRAGRNARARAFIQDGLGKAKTWADKRYDYAARTAARLATEL